VAKNKQQRFTPNFLCSKNEPIKRTFNLNLKNMKKKFITAVLFTLNYFVIAQIVIPPDSTYFYNDNGTKNWWYVQKDVFLYRMNTGACYTMSPNSTIDECKHLTNTLRKHNRLKFNAYHKRNYHYWNF
jgi:hypothetical protein